MRIRHLGLVDYLEAADDMRAFTLARTAQTEDEIWFLEHPPVFTQGQTGKPEHVLAAGDIPLVQSDRGGQVTYHGPGQLVAYLLVDIARRGYGVRRFVEKIEQAIAATLAGYGIASSVDRSAPGVYVELAGRRHKIASLGLRVREGRSYHGLAVNVAMDLAPFSRINPCGYAGLAMTQVGDLGGPADLTQVAADLQHQLLAAL